MLHGLGKPGRYCLLSVSDTGEGMDERMRQRIFEPFFTTKEVGKGTGLGLSIVYGIIKQHEGDISVYSQPGEGTTFRIYLPLMQSDSEEDVTAGQDLPKGGTETILFADDSEEVRVTTGFMLREFGYRVIEAVDGEDAMQKFIDNRENIDLVILDVIMPKRNGKEVYEEIRKIRPDLKVLFMSGYTGDILYRKGITEDELNFISKPVMPHDMLAKIRDLIDHS
jgi:CheY-like chemotaxis protein